MASTKITNAMREAIIRDLLTHRFAKAADKLVRDRAAFAVRVYNDVFSTSLRKKMADLPDGWLPAAAYVDAKYGVSHESISLNGAIGGKISRLASKPIDMVERPVPHNRWRQCLRVYEATHPIAEAHSVLDGRKRDLLREIETATVQADAAIGSVTTIGRLIELWPEIAPFARKHETTRALPAIPTADLNKLLDLPVAA